MLSSRFLHAIFAVVGYAAATGLHHSVDISGRQNSGKEKVAASTIILESVETSTLGGSTAFEIVLGDGNSWLLGTAASGITAVAIGPSTTLVVSSIDISLGVMTSTTTTVSRDATTGVIPIEIATTVTFESTPTVISIPDLVASLPDYDPSTFVTFDNITTAVTASGAFSAVTTTGSYASTVASGASSLMQIDGTTTTVRIESVLSPVSRGEVVDGSSVYTLPNSSLVPVSLIHNSSFIVPLTRISTNVIVSLRSTEVMPSRVETATMVIGTGSMTEYARSVGVISIALSDASSLMDIEGSDSIAFIQEAPGAGELTTQNTEAPGSTDVDMISNKPPHSSSPPGTATLSVANPTYREVARGTLTPKEEVQLQVLFSDRVGAPAFADYVVSYASQLVAQIDSVADIAAGDNDHAFTTAFDTIDITGILGLASAAPIYTCFLSSLWTQALSNPQQYAKRAVPTKDEKIKLIVLFEKRENSGMQFDFAKLLVDETNDLIAEIQNVSAAAANGDLAAYASLFANVDVPYFLSIATEAPIYTEGLSSAFESALSPFRTRFASVTVNATTSTTTSVNTYVANYVSGTVTVTTTIVATQTLVYVCDEICRTYTIVVNCDVVCTTETLSACIPPECTTVPAARPNTVQTRTITAERAPTTRRPSVAVYTQVEHGVTYTHTKNVTI